jgi:hypothetical protein
MTHYAGRARRRPLCVDPRGYWPRDASVVQPRQGARSAGLHLCPRPDGGDRRVAGSCRRVDHGKYLRPLSARCVAGCQRHAGAGCRAGQVVGTVAIVTHGLQRLRPRARVRKVLCHCRVPPRARRGEIPHSRVGLVRAIFDSARAFGAFAASDVGFRFASRGIATAPQRRLPLPLRQAVSKLCVNY